MKIFIKRGELVDNECYNLHMFVVLLYIGGIFKWNNMGKAKFLQKEDYRVLSLFDYVLLVLALASSLGGLYFWMKSIERDDISGYKLMLGSFLMAFVAACRPYFYWDLSLHRFFSGT